MEYSSLPRSPKNEEQQVPDTILFSEIVDARVDKETDVTDELESFWGMKEVEDLPEGKNMCGRLNWDFMDWEGFSVGEEEESDQKVADTGMYFQDDNNFNTVKSEKYGFWENDHEEEKQVSLNLSLNYQEVLDAWSDRGPPWADEFSLSIVNNGYVSVQTTCFTSFFFFFLAEFRYL
ncbi:hypothetical protein Vadar_025283 [Vaccinium darrowii]|uniref:Uncharacterized protein n=1 Tax=Vaccinium darrowii TaxID=229202 RepID=A0ACB7ZF53_9ERIC|nr:hypothetical protein Vadar_025283 [Vaccinium darrowii]